MPRPSSAGGAKLRPKRPRCRERLVAREESIEELRNRLSEKDASLADLQRQIAALTAKAAQLNQALVEQQNQAREKLALLDDAKRQLADAFKALAADALKSSNTSFLELAKTQLEKFQESAKGDLEKRQTAIDELVKPVKESLGKVDAKLQEIEKSRIEAYSGLTEQVRSLSESQKDLRSETANLVKALRRPRPAAAGAKSNCAAWWRWPACWSIATSSSSNRPTPKTAGFGPTWSCGCRGTRTSSSIRKRRWRRISKRSRPPTTKPARRSSRITPGRCVPTSPRWAGRRTSNSSISRPEFVVLFLPGEVFFSAALENDPSLIESGVSQNVIIATPTTLIALLRAVAYGWRQEVLAENAKAISELGQELYKRLSDLGEHIQQLGNGLAAAVNAYNSAVGSLESRVLVSARRFKELGAASIGGDIAEIAQIEASSRLLQAPELTEPSSPQIDGGH